ncbi:DUF3035 domain-containing protein [Pseudooceanicola spongiae]|uniref:DUF3035 domain-containing protein n=1 Tax=Pseudooceanicola spongiae TaxID=2613965 RepID=A0A7L9WPL4_9RHOB|nr:DUF3035 domain-containing protein [Pseudooceanicola spongiae]QOL82251.1 DUF3035 domain-containing protein [Pseudooceanicola spongiae]
MMARGLILTTVCVLLAGCSDGTTLRGMRNTSAGPEEFNVAPTRELETPDNLAALPVPTPGGANLVDQTPKADAVAALGGNPAALNGTAVAAADGALVSYAGRAGIDARIRPTLAAEDQAFREREARFSRLRLFGSDRYYMAYQKQTLDAQATARKFRRAGVPTPSAPPGR